MIHDRIRLRKERRQHLGFQRKKHLCERRHDKDKNISFRQRKAKIGILMAVPGVIMMMTMMMMTTLG